MVHWACRRLIAGYSELTKCTKRLTPVWPNIVKSMSTMSIKAGEDDGKRTTYDELQDLLSDSGEWEDMGRQNRLKRKAVNNRSFDEDEDDFLLEMFQPTTTTAAHPISPKRTKTLKGASFVSPYRAVVAAPVKSQSKTEIKTPIAASSTQKAIDNTPLSKKFLSPVIKKELLRDTSLENVNSTTQTSSQPIPVVEHKPQVQYAEQFALLTQKANFADVHTNPRKLPSIPDATVKIPIRLSKEQENVIKLAKQGHNIFYTGSAGTGKSILLREMIKVLKSIYGKEQVAVTASTGLAACNIGGITVHSFAGIGLGNGDNNTLYKKVRRSRKHLKRWESINALIIDEISMLNGELLDKLDFIAKKVRKNREPFGGIQLIFCGDFFQLPPVTKNNQASTDFAFESNVWKEGIEITIMLTKVFRQRGDLKFIDMLNKMRLGEIDEDAEREFKKLSRPLPEDEIIPAELYSTRNEVDRANNQRLSRLPGRVQIYKAIDGGNLQDDEMKEKLLQNFLAPKELQLKVGAQVMMIKNVDATLVNGSLGKVIDFIDADTYMFYETVMKNPDMSPEELENYKKNPDLLRDLWKEESEENDSPVRHKTTKEAFCRYDPDESNISLNESIFDFLMEASGDDTETINNLQRKRELLQEIHKSSSSRRKLPLVRFKTSDMSTRTILVEPEDWAIEDENEKPIVSRVQLPLMLAWSLSIHKSQGQTLPKVKVDLRRVFEKGQAYVALSRAVSREGLQVLNFDKTRIKAHEKVVQYYETLMSVDHAMRQFSDMTKNITNTNGTSAKDTKPNLAPKYVAQRKLKAPPTGIAAMLQKRSRSKKTKSETNNEIILN